LLYHSKAVPEGLTPSLDDKLQVNYAANAALFVMLDEN
jgi:hypothetical protein